MKVFFSSVPPLLLTFCIEFDEAGEYSSFMDKKEINSPKLTSHFLFWVCGIGGLVLAFLFAHFVYHVV